VRNLFEKCEERGGPWTGSMVGWIARNAQNRLGGSGSSKADSATAVLSTPTRSRKRSKMPKHASAGRCEKRITFKDKKKKLSKAKIRRAELPVNNFPGAF